MKKFAHAFTAIFFPWLTFLILDKPLHALVAMILQATLFGWLPASIWAWKTVFPKSQPPADTQTTPPSQERSPTKKQ